MMDDPIKYNNPPDSEFKEHLYASLTKLNELLPAGSFPQLQQELEAFLSAAENPVNNETSLLTGLRLKIYALLALTR